MNNERIRLYSKEELNEITDAEHLNSYIDEVEAAVTKIETDLEFADGDDDWFRRAKAALMAHRISLRLARRRHHRLVSRPAPVSPSTKAERLAASSAKIQAEAVLRKVAQNKKQVEAQKIARGVLERVNFGHVFMHIVKRNMSEKDYEFLLNETYAEISARAEQILIKQPEPEHG